ncbi:DUF6368 family protein [Streptacidiphilus anmyonensis]|uniref:DUF6368 family protein n=1 Tax=Streptacidiphilus anmyonensis TaxID=405782 RepID=UPI0005A73410|nr:DUF6368 family protein [Streptacidiphilus anmyonensis]
MSIDGAGHGDGCDGFYEQGEFSEESEYLLPLLGFTPTNILCVLAWASRQPYHFTVARLSADIVDLTGGVAVVSLYDHQVDTARQLPGVLAMDVEEGAAYATGGSAFLRAFAATPGFRLLK